MRTLVDIPEQDVKLLDSLGERENTSRAELVRRAISQYLAAEKEKTSNALDQYFGFLKDDPAAFDGMDGLAWQEKMRGEWYERDADIDRRLSENAHGLHESQNQNDFNTGPLDSKPIDKE